MCGEGPGEARAVPACLYRPARSPHGWGGGSGVRPTCAPSPGSAGGAPAAAPEPPKPKCQGCACCHTAFACTRGCRSFTSLSTGGRGELKAAPAPGLRGSRSPPCSLWMLRMPLGWGAVVTVILPSWPLCFAANSSGCGGTLRAAQLVGTAGATAHAPQGWVQAAATRGIFH